MSSSDLAGKISEHIRQNGPSKATEIAKSLGVDRSVVNSVLYGQLRGKVRQSKNYTWSLSGNETQQGQTPPKTLETPMRVCSAIILIAFLKMTTAASRCLPILDTT